MCLVNGFNWYVITYFTQSFKIFYLQYVSYKRLLFFNSIFIYCFSLIFQENTNRHQDLLGTQFLLNVTLMFYKNQITHSTSVLIRISLYITDFRYITLSFSDFYYWNFSFVSLDFVHLIFYVLSTLVFIHFNFSNVVQFIFLACQPRNVYLF